VSLQIYSVRRKIRVILFQSSVSSFATRTRRKLLCSHLSGRGRYKIPGFSERTQGWALSRRYLYGDKIFGSLKFTNYVNDYLVSGLRTGGWEVLCSRVLRRSSSKIQKHAIPTNKWVGNGHHPGHQHTSTRKFLPGTIYFIVIVMGHAYTRN
jgi:hypothetical protein